MAKKVSTNISIDSELKSKCTDNKINISKAAEIGIKILLNNIEYSVLENIINQFSLKVSKEEVEESLKIRQEIQLTECLKKELKLLAIEFTKLMKSWLNPINNKNFKDIVSECAIKLKLNNLNLLKLIYHYQTDPSLDIESLNYSEIKKIETNKDDIEIISAKIDKIIDIDFRQKLKDKKNDLGRISATPFDELNNYPENNERLQKHAEMLKLPIENLYLIGENLFWNVIDIEDITRNWCLNLDIS